MLLTEKYKLQLESEKMPFLAESEKPGMALLLENQEKERVNEATVSSDVHPFIPILMPLARKIQPNLIANTLVGVQPLKSPTGYIYSLTFRYTGSGMDKDDKSNATRISPVAGGQIVTLESAASVMTKGQEIKCDGQTATVIHVEDLTILIDKAICGATKEVTNSADEVIGTVSVTYSNELSFRKILKAYSGPLPTAQAELLGYDMAEVGFELSQTQVGVYSRKLKAEYTVEMFDDLKKMHGLNADEELMNVMAVEVQNELDREIVDKVNDWAAPAGDFTIGGNSASGSTRFELENMAHLGLKIANESREIARLTRRGAGNILLVSPKVATVLEQIKGYKAIESNSTVDSAAVGVAVIGTFNKMKVVMDAFAISEYCTVLYKGSDRRDAIGYFAPYVPVSFTRVVNYETAQPGIVLQTRYGIVENPLNATQGSYARTFAVNFDSTSVLSN